MEIKETQGQTLLTLLRVAIYGVAALCVFGFHGIADSLTGFFSGSTDMDTVTESERHSSVYGDSYILYYDQAIQKDSYLHIYRQYYISGSDDKVGLVNSAGQVLLEQKYQGIVVLPESYILKEDGKWRFYSHELELLSDEEWDSVELSLNEKDKLSSELVKVCRDGLYGATDLMGEIAVSPHWDSLELYTRTADWQLLRVSSDGDWGYIYPNGNTAVRVRYDYVQTGTYTKEVPGEAEPESIPVIFVCDDGDWGGIFRDRDGDPGSVDWDIEPTSEILEDYHTNGGENAE